MRYATAIALLLFLAAAATLTACSGSDSAPPGDSLDDLDTETRETWATWAAEASVIARVTNQRYRTGSLTVVLGREHLATARALAAEIRDSDAAGEPVLELADGLDDLVHGLEFGLDYATTAGVAVINIEVTTLADALLELDNDATSLFERLGVDPTALAEEDG
jgi:hypothetical protein